MSYVRYYTGNLRSDGTFCQWDGVSACRTLLVIVLEGELHSIEESAPPGGTCPGSSDVVVYDSGNLKTTSVDSWICTVV
ncbi:MAG: hypothetical protein QXT64_03390 [Desulfurococcaceae archaeon]